VVRGVSDSARDDLPAELIRLLRDDGRIGVGSAVALAFTRPLVLVRGIALGRGARRALAAVGRALAVLAWPDQ